MVECTCAGSNALPGLPCFTLPLFSFSLPNRAFICMIGCCGGFGTQGCVFCDVTSRNGFNIVYEVRDTQARIY